MGKHESYDRVQLIGEQSFQRLLERLRETEGLQINFDTFIDILNSSEDELEYGFKVVKELRSDLTRKEEISLLSLFMGTAMFCWNILMGWTSLRKIEEKYHLSVDYLLQQSKARSALSYIYHLQKNGLLEISTENWEDELELNIKALQGYHDFFLSCFNYFSFFFAVPEWEETNYEGFSVQKDIENTIRNYRNIGDRLPSTQVLVGQAVFVEISRAGSLILEALATQEAKKINEAKAHLQRVKDFLLRKGKPLRSLEKLTTIGKNTPSFSQILFLLKKMQIKHPAKASDTHLGQPFLITLPSNVAYYFNQPLSLKERLDIHRESLVQFIISSLPDDFEGIHKEVQGSTMAHSLEKWTSFCDALYWQRLDYVTIKESFTNYVIAKYRIEKKEAARVYEFLKDKVGPEDLILLYALADIMVARCLKNGEIHWETLRILVASDFIAKVLRWLRRRKS